MKKPLWILIVCNVLIITAIAIVAGIGAGSVGAAEGGYIVVLIGIGPFVVFNVIYLVVWRIMANRARKKQPTTSDGNKIRVLVIVPFIIIGAVVGFLVSFGFGYDYITCVIIGAALGATIWFIRAYRVRRK